MTRFLSRITFRERLDYRTFCRECAFPLIWIGFGPVSAQGFSVWRSHENLHAHAWKILRIHTGLWAFVLALYIMRLLPRLDSFTITQVFNHRHHLGYIRVHLQKAVLSRWKTWNTPLTNLEMRLKLRVIYIYHMVFTMCKILNIYKSKQNI
jgi:hypothetical protein